MRAGWIALPVVVAAVGACDGLTNHLDCTAVPGICDPPDGGADGSVDVPSDCNLTQSPKDSPACVTDGVGVFVSPTGKDGAAGTKADPMKSIAAAATVGKPRIYVCEGTYDAAVEIKAAVSVYGGFSCAWTYTGQRAKLAPPKGVALRVTKVNGAVVLEDLEVVGSADANTPGDSAIAAFVSESDNVTFRNVALSAGAGTAGVKGASRSNYSGATATTGGNANAAVGGAGPTCTCIDATSSKGGNGAGGNGVGVSDGAATPTIGSPNGGLSGTATCVDGQAGANGLASGTATPPTDPGKLLASGWTSQVDAVASPNGKPGQGGGGGGAKTTINSAGGGGGGCGGCGGAGGASGTNGGSSFALLSFKSTVMVAAGTMTTAAGGRAGDGGDGQAGQTGGAVGAGVCNGGLGGNGAGGSGGSGGAGGHSAAVAFVGTEPRVSGTTLTPGTKGAGGTGGLPGAGPGNVGASGATGVDGKSQGSLAL